MELLAAASPDLSPLLDFGVVGVILLFFVWVAKLFYNDLKKSWQDQIDQYRRAYEYEQARAAEAEEELKRFTDQTIEKTLPVLHSAMSLIQRMGTRDES